MRASFLKQKEIIEKLHMSLDYLDRQSKGGVNYEEADVAIKELLEKNDELLEKNIELKEKLNLMKREQESHAVKLTKLLDTMIPLESEKYDVESRYEDAPEKMNGKDLVMKRKWNEIQSQDDLINIISERTQNIETKSQRLKKKNDLSNELKVEKEINVRLTKFDESVLELNKLLVKQKEQLIGKDKVTMKNITKEKGETSKCKQ